LPPGPRLATLLAVVPIPGGPVPAPIQIRIDLPNLSDEERVRLELCGRDIDDVLKRHDIAIAAMAILSDGKIVPLWRLVPLRRIVEAREPEHNGGARRW